jgi:integrase/recombinase XerD
MKHDFSRLEQELKIRGYSKKTNKVYLYHNQQFLKFCKKSSLQINKQDVKRYLEYLLDKDLARATVRLICNALKFYYSQVLRRNLFQEIKLPKKDQKTVLPLTKEEILHLIDVTKNPKHKLLIELLYGSGLRVGEVVKLKFKDLFLQERLLLVRKGKGRKDRKVILSERALKNLSSFDFNEGYIFPGRGGHITIRTVQAIFEQVARKANLSKNVHPHMLRHSFASHLKDNKVETKDIQKLLGHSNKRTTERYLHRIDMDMKKIKSPLD